MLSSPGPPSICQIEQSFQRLARSRQGDYYKLGIFTSSEFQSFSCCNYFLQVYFLITAVSLPLPSSGSIFHLCLIFFCNMVPWSIWPKFLLQKLNLSTFFNRHCIKPVNLRKMVICNQPTCIGGPFWMDESF